MKSLRKGINNPFTTANGKQVVTRDSHSPECSKLVGIYDTITIVSVSRNLSISSLDGGLDTRLASR